MRSETQRIRKRVDEELAIPKPEEDADTRTEERE